MKSLLHKILIFCCISLGLFFIAQRVIFFRQGLLERVASIITYPVFVVGESINSHICATKNYLQTNAALHSRCNELECYNEKLYQELIELKSSARVFEQSKDHVSFLQRYNLEDKLCAKVLVQHFGQDENYVYINRGSRDGVIVDMIALYKFQIFGRVTVVYPWYSKVVLITDSHSKISAYANSTSAEGIVKGTNNLDECEFLYVSNLLSVTKEDLVISSGQGLIFPEGFCLGQITRHETRADELYHRISVKPLINFKDIRFCWLTDQSKIEIF